MTFWTCLAPNSDIGRFVNKPNAPTAFWRRLMSSEDFVPPLAANMNAAFKKVRGAIGDADPVLRDQIATRIVELAKIGVYDVEELSRQTLSSLKSE
jgi:hypothetical protein